MMGCVIGEPISSSGVTRKVTGRAAVPLRRQNQAPPFMS
jgi:hypothetical protein